jgi:hypothetical protein
MKRLVSVFVLLVCCVFGFAAPRIPEKPIRPERMTPVELFDWAMNAPVESKPWRDVARIESAQADPIQWGWNVNSALEEAIAKKKYPKCQGITIWRACISFGESKDAISPDHVSVTIWHLRVTNGEMGKVNAIDW